MLAQVFFKVHKVLDHTVDVLKLTIIFLNCYISPFASDKFPNVLCRHKGRRSTNGRTGRGLVLPSSCTDCDLRNKTEMKIFSSLLFFFSGFSEHYINSALYIYSWFLSSSFDSANTINRSICTNPSFIKSVWLSIIPEHYRYILHFKVKESISCTLIYLHNRVKVKQLIYLSN